MQSIKSIVILSLLFLSLFSKAQNTGKDLLFESLRQMDSLIFDVAFNQCKTEVLADTIAEDLEFYHDKSGATHSKEAFMKIMKNGICNPDNPTVSRRELVDGSLEVFPLYNNGKLYAALQNGKHRFFEKVGDAPESKGSIALFSHLWIKDENKWILKRVISYDHNSQ